jgi:glucose/arabinose dehydrogenase
MKSSLAAIACLAVAFALTSAVRESPAQAIEAGDVEVELKVVATVSGGFNIAPNFGAHYGDPRFLFIGQQNGIIRTLDFNQANPLLGTDFLNVRTILGTTFTSVATVERGLLGGAFHPDFNNAGTAGFRKFYTFTSETITSATPHFMHQSEPYQPPTIPYNHQSVVREWTAGEPNANGVISIDTNIASRVLMRIGKPQQGHNAGTLVFGPDNYLYISLGDGGCCFDNDDGVNDANDGHTNQNDPDTPGGYTGHGNAQDRRNVYGKILRIKPTTEEEEPEPTTFLSANEAYRIPFDNPFTAETNAMTPVTGWQDNWVDEIWAYGFRNPFRISFDRETGALYAGDVGQTSGTSREEIDLVVKGGNYGWVIKQGTLATPYNYSAAPGTTLINPIGQYPTGLTGGSAALGGFVYRGDAIDDLEELYVFADYRRWGDGTRGAMLYLDPDESGELNQVYELAITGPVAMPVSFIHGVAEDANGEIYYLLNNGQVIKLLPAGNNGDFNRDGVVDVADFVAWQKGAGVASTPEKYQLWRSNYGDPGGGAGGRASVPEPTWAPFLLAALMWSRRLTARRRALEN